ncbi:GIY-YIG nuclease family protein [Pseudoxanthomonas mexicana]
MAILTRFNARRDRSIVWWTYVLACEGDVLYVGISPDPMKRFRDHQLGRSRFSRIRKPRELLACLPVGSHRDASHQERWLKGQSRQGKLLWASMVRQSPFWISLLERHGGEAFLARPLSHQGQTSRSPSPP